MVNLSEKQQNILEKIIEFIISIYSNHLEAMYVISYNGGRDPEINESIEYPNIKIGFIYDKPINTKEITLDNLIDEIGLNIIISQHSYLDYQTCENTIQKYIACRDLVSSTILFDRDNIYFNLKNNLLKQGIPTLLELEEINPPFELIKIKSTI